VRPATARYSEVSSMAVYWNERTTVHASRLTKLSGFNFEIVVLKPDARHNNKKFDTQNKNKKNSACSECRGEK